MVRFDNVGMRYGRGPEVLRDISFHLKPGSFHFLTGTSGAGKTSLLRLLFLANRPSRGLITMFDHDIATTPHATLPDLRRKIGVVFQDFRLLEHLSALENVALPLRITGAEEDGIEENVTELLIWVGLKDRLHAKPSSLSGGEQQRVAIARALIARPDLFLADEPTGNVDPEMGQRLMHLFQELNKLGTTTVIATHDLRLMERNDFARLHLDRGMLNYIPGETGLARNLDVPHAGPGHLPTSAFDV